MPGSDGVYGIFNTEGVKSNDPDFDEVYKRAGVLKRKTGALAPAPGTSVVVAVVDSGIVSIGDAYFGDRIEGVNAQGGDVQLTFGRPSTEGQHGAHVGSIAAYGTPMIKIMDVQVARTQEGGKVELSTWTTAFKWATEQRARVINVSIVCPWSNPAIKGMVERNTGTLFLATSGNAHIKFTSEDRSKSGLDKGNVILVGGCARDGAQMHERGFGEGIDIFVPSVDVPGYTSKRFAQKINYDRALKFRQGEVEKLKKEEKENCRD
jgi:hypothetical protein